jgi:hypothetical protein
MGLEELLIVVFRCVISAAAGCVWSARLLLIWPLVRRRSPAWCCVLGIILFEMLSRTGVFKLIDVTRSWNMYLLFPWNVSIDLIKLLCVGLNYVQDKKSVLGREC